MRTSSGFAIATVGAGCCALPFLLPTSAHADDTRQCEPWSGYSVCYQQSDDTWWMCNPDCSQIPPPVHPFPGLPPVLPPGAPAPPPPTQGPPPPSWPEPPPIFPGCWVINGCVQNPWDPSSPSPPYAFFPISTF